MRNEGNTKSLGYATRDITDAHGRLLIAKGKPVTKHMEKIIRSRDMTYGEYSIDSPNKEIELPKLKEENVNKSLSTISTKYGFPEYLLSNSHALTTEVLKTIEQNGRLHKVLVSGKQ